MSAAAATHRQLPDGFPGGGQSPLRASELLLPAEDPPMHAADKDNTIQFGEGMQRNQSGAARVDNDHKPVS